MKVRALQLGEHPQGVWRNPGETFNFDGKKPGKWMEKVSAKEAKSEDAETAAKAAQVEAEAKAAAEAEEAAEALAKETADKLAAEGNDGEGDDVSEPPFKAIHRGAGKWDVFDSDLKVVEGGDNLNKEDAKALEAKLLAEAAE